MLRKISAIVLAVTMLATGCAGAATYTERDAALGLSEEYVAGMTEFYSLTTMDPESGKTVTLSWAELENGGYIDTEAGTEAGNLTFLNADGEEVSVSDGDVWDEPVFKDLNRNGALDTYEDWRLSSEERAQGLVDLLAGDEIWTLEDGRAPEGLFQLFGLTLENGGEAPTTITMTDATRDQIMNLGVRGILYGGSWSQDTEEDALLA